MGMTVEGTLSNSNFLKSGWIQPIDSNTLGLTSYGDDAFSLIGITDTDSPSLLGQVVDNTYLNGAEDMARIKETMLVTATIANMITAVDITDRANPALIANGYLQDNTYLEGAEAIQVKYYPTHGWVAFVCAWNSKYFTSVDVNDVTNMSVLDYVDVGNNPIYVRLGGNVAFMTVQGAAQFRAVDITDPTDMSILGSVGVGTCKGFDMDDDYAYIAHYAQDTLKIVDKSDPTDMSVVGDTGAHPDGKMAGCLVPVVVGDHVVITAYTADSLVEIDVSDRTNPTYTDYITDSDIESPDDVIWFRDRLCVSTHYIDKFAVVSSTNLESLYGTEVTIDSRDKRAGAQAMLWSPLHPEPDGGAFTQADRRMVQGVYPGCLFTEVSSGSSVGTRGRIGGLSSRGDAPRLVGRYLPEIDK